MSGTSGTHASGDQLNAPNDALPPPGGTAPTRREMRKIELRSRILGASRKLFAEKGFDETTIGDICETADVARRTLYSYFATKSDIIRALCRADVIDETLNIIAMANEQHDDIGPRLRFVLDRMINQTADADPLRKILIQQLATEQYGPNAPQSQLVEELHDAFVSLFSTASDIKGLSVSMSPALSAELLISLISAMSINWISNPDYPLLENFKEIECYLLANLAAKS